METKEKLVKLHPLLVSIEKEHQREDLRSLARELSIGFRTFGAVRQEKEKLLVEPIEENRDLREETYRNGFLCLQDASVPIRAHGLIIFRRLIERADRETCSKIEENIDEHFQLFEKHLDAEDSYEYLAAINVFSALANRYTERVLKILCDQYLNADGKTRKAEDQLKIGEILLKTCKCLGLTNLRLKIKTKRTA